jgi:hypothetical protein
VTDGIATATADAYHLDLGALVERLIFNHFNGHFSLLILTLLNI